MRKTRTNLNVLKSGLQKRTDPCMVTQTMAISALAPLQTFSSHQSPFENLPAHSSPVSDQPCSWNPSPRSVPSSGSRGLALNLLEHTLATWTYSSVPHFATTTSDNSVRLSANMATCHDDAIASHSLAYPNYALPYRGLPAEIRMLTWRHNLSSVLHVDPGARALITEHQRNISMWDEDESDDDEIDVSLLPSWSK